MAGLKAKGRDMHIGFINLGYSELIVVLLIVLLLFGAKRVPDLARALGRSLKEFKRGREEGAVDEDASDPPKPEA